MTEHSDKSGRKNSFPLEIRHECQFANGHELMSFLVILALEVDV